MSDDEEGKQKKLPTDEELPTSADDDEERKEEQSDDYVVYLGGSYVHYYRGFDGKMRTREYLAEELIDEDVSDEDLRKEITAIDLDAIRAVQDADKGATVRAPVKGAGTEEPRHSSVSVDLQLYFSKSELERFVEYRKTGLRPKSIDWIDRASKPLWDCTRGDVSYETITTLRTFTLEKYKSVDSHSKVLSFARAFLSHLAKTRQDTRYQSFNVFLDLPKALRERKATSRIVTKEDINSVLRHIRKAEREGRISPQKSAQYSAFVTFGAFSGQRSESTMSKLTVGQFREALQSDKPCIEVKSSQDKILMAHFTPIHPQAAKAVKPLLEGRGDDERMFEYESFLMWVKRERIPMSKFKGHFVLGDQRKFFEQQGDAIQMNESIRAHIATHGVGGVAFKHYRNPQKETVYDVYMSVWRDVELG